MPSTDAPVAIQLADMIDRHELRTLVSRCQSHETNEQYADAAVERQRRLFVRFHDRRVQRTSGRRFESLPRTSCRLSEERRSWAPAKHEHSLRPTKADCTPSALRSIIIFADRKAGESGCGRHCSHGAECHLAGVGCDIARRILQFRRQVLESIADTRDEFSGRFCIYTHHLFVSW